MKQYLKYFLVLLCVLVWLAVFSLFKVDDNLHIVSCNVGQGDSILISLGSFQILTDGGPDNKVLRCLGNHMPFWDRKIDVVILTHPQLDHYGGFLEVFKRYEIGTFVANEVDSSTPMYTLLKNVVGSQGIKVVNPRQGMKIRYGLLYLDILNPSQTIYDEAIVKDNSKVLGTFDTKRDLNDFSVVDRINYGHFKAILTGDIGPNMLPEIISSNNLSKVIYLKVPHHGSKNGMTQEFLDILDPEIAVISVGAKNLYGHPSPEIIKMLEDKRVLTKRTDKDGDVEVITDGQKWWLVK